MTALSKRGPGRPRKIPSSTLTDDPFITAKQAEAICGISSTTLRRAIGRGELKASRWLNSPDAQPNRYSRYLVRKSELERWFNSRTA